MNQKPTPNSIRLSALLALACGLACTAAAQTTPAATPAPAPAASTAAPAGTAAATTSSDDDVTQLEKMTVSDVPLDQQVLPTVRPVGNVMGDDQNIIDIPRSVSSVNAAWMEDRNVRNAMDFGQFSPGVYSAAQYGIPAVPFIRGDLAQMYVDGQVMPYTRNSTPPSFNGVQAMDIVKGPGSAVYGPQGEGAGGYVDFVMKAPYFDGFQGDADFTWGAWTSGHSYSNPEFSLDFGGPVNDKVAYRVSYLSRYGDGYYINDHDQTQDVYAALTYLATKSLKIETWFQGFEDRTNEITGANRVTQQFINNGTYLAGPASPTTVGPNAYFGYDIATVGAAPGTYGTYTDGSYSTVNPSTAHGVYLEPYDALIGPNDVARSKLFQWQTKTTLDLNGDSSVVNRMYFADGSSHKFETYGYDEYVPVQQTAQDRIEYHGEFDAGPVSNNLITGLDERYTALISYQDFTTEPFSYYDLTQPLSQISYPGYALEGNTFGGGAQVPGGGGYSAGASNPDDGSNSGNQDSQIYDSAAFVQDSFKLGKLTITPGYRVDRIFAETASPPVVEVGYAAFFTYYPLATPIFIGKGQSSPLWVDETGVTLPTAGPAGQPESLGNHPTYMGFSADGYATDQSYFVSAVYKLTESASVYATYDRASAVLGTSNFGGVNVSADIYGIDSASQQLQTALNAVSTLYEFGYKQSFLNNTAYFDLVAFQQSKLGVQLGGATDRIRDEGVEYQVVYQPNKRWTLNANLTYQDATSFGPKYFQQTGNYLDSYDPSTVVDGQNGTGLGDPNFISWFPANQRMRTPGIPQLQINAFVEYTAPQGYGIGLGPQFIGKQYANDQDTLQIPAETELDGFVSYRHKSWEFRVNVTNITNARLVDPIDVSFAGNDTIFVRKPISASLTIKKHF
jgi:outer membrane receptor for Fe3+-dicitrate